MHYLCWLRRHRRRMRMGVFPKKDWKEVAELVKELRDALEEPLKRPVPKRKEITSSGFKDYIGVVVGIDPRTLMELKRKAGVQDNEQAVLKAIRHYLRCPYDINGED